MDATKISAFVDAALLLIESIEDECEDCLEASLQCDHIQLLMRGLLEIVNEPSDDAPEAPQPPPLTAFQDVPKYEGYRTVE